MKLITVVKSPCKRNWVIRELDFSKILKIIFLIFFPVGPIFRQSNWDVRKRGKIAFPQLKSRLRISWKLSLNLRSRKLLILCLNLASSITHKCPKCFQAANQETADLVTFTEEIITGKLHFCAVTVSNFWNTNASH